MRKEELAIKLDLFALALSILGVLTAAINQDVTPTGLFCALSLVAWTKTLFHRQILKERLAKEAAEEE